MDFLYYNIDYFSKFLYLALFLFIKVEWLFYEYFMLIRIVQEYRDKIDLSKVSYSLIQLQLVDCKITVIIHIKDLSKLFCNQLCFPLNNLFITVKFYHKYPLTLDVISVICVRIEGSRLDFFIFFLFYFIF